LIASAGERRELLEVGPVPVDRAAAAAGDLEGDGILVDQVAKRQLKQP
jgi:hypothetical protein